MMMVLARQRILVFLGLTSLLATMLMVTRYNTVISSDSNHIRKQPLSSVKIQPLSSNSFKVIYFNQNAQPAAHSSNDSAQSSSSLPNLPGGHPGPRGPLLGHLPDSPRQAASSDQLISSPANSPDSISLSFSSSSNGRSSSSSPLSSLSSSTSVPGASVPAPGPASQTAAAPAPAQAMGTGGRVPETEALGDRANKPKITFGKEDLRSTEKFVIDKPLFCDTDKGATVDLLVVVTSAVQHFEAREAIRKTWGAFSVERGALVLFLLGSPANPELQNAVLQEESRYGDILQGSFIDDYYNLTLKTISLMHWVNQTCNQVKYVLKVDDDMFVNMQMVVDFSETRTFNKAIIGKLARKWRPHREPHSKWFVPSSAFNGTLYPNFATGPAYMFTGDATELLLDTALRLTPIYLEDVYMTGIVAEKAGVRRLNHALIKNVRLRVDACTFRRFMTSHRHTPKEIVSLWKAVYEGPTKPCLEAKPKPAAAAAAATDKKPLPKEGKEKEAPKDADKGHKVSPEKQAVAGKP